MINNNLLQQVWVIPVFTYD